MWRKNNINGLNVNTKQQKEFRKNHNPGIFLTELVGADVLEK